MDGMAYVRTVLGKNMETWRKSLHLSIPDAFTCVYERFYFLFSTANFPPFYRRAAYALYYFLPPLNSTVPFVPFIQNSEAMQ